MQKADGTVIINRYVRNIWHEYKFSKETFIISIYYNNTFIDTIFQIKLMPYNLIDIQLIVCITIFLAFDKFNLTKTRTFFPKKNQD